MKSSGGSRSSKRGRAEAPDEKLRRMMDADNEELSDDSDEEINRWLLRYETLNNIFCAVKVMPCIIRL